METALKIEHLNKTLGKKQILHDVSFETYKGEVFGFLGPNGAGKTTTIKIAVGMLFLDEGEISICGVDIKKNFEDAMSLVGGIVENPEMYKELSGMDNLKQYARMRKGVDQERIDRVVEIVGLSNRINDKVKKYSLGMRQRLGVAQAILHRPEVLILDEPTNGLDPAGIKGLRNVLIRIAHEENCSVIVSSHLMSEMELMCDRVGIIANGKMLAIKQIDEFKEEAFGNSLKYSVVTADNDKAMQLIKSKFDVEAKLSGDGIKVEVSIPKESDVKISGINRALIEDGIDIETVVQEESRSLEDAFIQLTAQEGGNQIA